MQIANCYLRDIIKLGKHLIMGEKEKEKITMKGSFRMELFRDGKLIEVREFDNMVVNAGLAAIAGCILLDVATNRFDYIALGTDGTAPSATQTALLAETHRQAGTGTRVTTSNPNDTAQLSTTFTFGGSYGLQESGVFNASSDGDMLCRQTFSVLNVQNNDQLTVTWKVQFSRG